MARNNFSHDEAQQRINAQMSLDEKCQRATIVIDNNGSLEETDKQVEELVKQLRASKRHWILRVGLLATVYAVYASVCYVFGTSPWLSFDTSYVGYLKDKMGSFVTGIMGKLSF